MSLCSPLKILPGASSSSSSSTASSQIRPPSLSLSASLSEELRVEECGSPRVGAKESSFYCTEQPAQSSYSREDKLCLLLH
ncbi:uncharacterized protein CELE_ZC477.4 [Caenorhabditis elegans]|uniref:Secreted protein n=1 Tax=Caenorhabditis elegans TaxID=6239 RepID=Q23341_CAEEL|nr:Secreted protein [Caenorhabditis elegans]CCD66630.1 Secreted protein [Caenorhabditis elegans]|eukprot:NP_501106.1 Uncharacterized protein CELE_ZC477.4 [Caenorhabditis elegans]